MLLIAAKDRAIGSTTGLLDGVEELSDSESDESEVESSEESDVSVSDSLVVSGEDDESALVGTVFDSI